jgi:hypothetical protein
MQGVAAHHTCFSSFAGVSPPILISALVYPIRVLLADQYFDIFALNETRLDDNISNQDMFIHNYDLIRADRSRTGGGVCLYVRNPLIISIEMTWLGIILKHFVSRFINPLVHPLLSEAFIGLQVPLSTHLPILSN